MNSRINEFLHDWTQEAKMTVTIFKAVEEGRKSERPNENIRSLERLAWHITQTLTEMPLKAGLIDSDPYEHMDIPSSFQEIIDIYKANSRQLAAAIQEKWTDENLSEEVNMYGSNWTKATILSVLIRHQAHHRGQMTMLMRVLGMKVPGIYGPAREEWSQMGMAAMD